MLFSFPQTFTVTRPGLKPDPYTPGGTIPDWDHTTTLTVNGFLTRTLSDETPNLNRNELAEAATLTIDSAGAPVQLDDRIEDPDGRLWQVTGIPITEQNPFTGWHPVTVVRLQRWQG